jgi:hypothetical protein
LTLPKSEQAKPRRISINSGGQQSQVGSGEQDLTQGTAGAHVGQTDERPAA